MNFVELLPYGSITVNNRQAMKATLLRLLLGTVGPLNSTDVSLQIYITILDKATTKRYCNQGARVFYFLGLSLYINNYLLQFSVGLKNFCFEI